ncbi:hypothetical protein BDR05DRAFT_1006352 [Suillus weaverae]|nr:hypothetical protein BDR05DRAFT_1006352 [Suillus weaverae]
MTPRVWPNWHSIGHDDPRVSKHTWRNKVRAWEVLGDNSCDLHVVPNPSTGPLTVDLPSPPIPLSAPVLPSPPIPPSTPVLPSPPIVAGSSSQTMSEFRDKGKGKEVAVDIEPEVEGSRKRKSPMISGHSSQPPKSVMKGRKRVKSTRPVKSKLIVESEDDEDTTPSVSNETKDLLLNQHIWSTTDLTFKALPFNCTHPPELLFGLTGFTTLDVATILQAVTETWTQDEIHDHIEALFSKCGLPDNKIIYKATQDFISSCRIELLDFKITSGLSVPRFNILTTSPTNNHQWVWNRDSTLHLSNFPFPRPPTRFMPIPTHPPLERPKSGQQEQHQYVSPNWKDYGGQTWTKHLT